MKIMEMTKKLSVFCLTYNHVDYIEDALKGFLAQKTNFIFNVVIYDDASTDGTSEIVRKYAERYPNIINAYISPVNLYEKAERHSVINKLYDEFLTGEYIAWCEGDDYWIDENKLQIQVDFLDSHPECSMTTHTYDLLDCKDGTHNLVRILSSNGYMSTEQVINKTCGWITTGSFVVRRNAFFLNEKFPKCDVFDFPLQLNALCYGKIYYFDKCMSVYRFMHHGSWWESMQTDFKKTIVHKLNFAVFLKRFDEYSNYKFSKYILKLYRSYLYALAETKVTLFEFQGYYDELYPIIGEEEQYLYDQVFTLFRWYNKLYQIPDSMLSKCKEFKNIIVMGNGTYGKIVSLVLKKNGLKVKGFILSHKDDNGTDVNVWGIDEYPYNKERTLVVVGIQQNNSDGVVEILHDNHFKYIWTPVWIDNKFILNDQQG